MRKDLAMPYMKENLTHTRLKPQCLHTSAEPKREFWLWPLHSCALLCSYTVHADLLPMLQDSVKSQL
jgi:hypothetical protein